MRLNREHLHDYQLKAIDFIKTQERCALFLDMGLGKTTSTLTAVSDLQDEFAVNKVLVIAPLRVANSTWKQEVEKWKHLEHLKVSVCTGTEKARRAALHRDADVYVINRENVLWLVELYKAKWPFDCVVVDECFTGDTEVLTPSGALLIKNISVGDVVMTSNGPEKVSRVFKKEVTRLVRVQLDDGTKIECTPEHPFATELGWVQAVDTKGLRVLRSGVQDEGQDKQVLQQKLFQKSHVGIENRLGEEGDHRKSFCQFDGQEAVECGETLVKVGAKETERCPQVEWSQTKNSWWERAYRPVRKTNDGDVVLGLDASACNPNQSAEGEWLPNVLQSGFCGPGSENDNRSGRGISQIAKASGRKEGQFSKISRVVDVESFECESPRTVYNLETDGVHDYFAGSTLVHNCSSFKNPSAKRFRALKKVLPYTNYMILLTGTPSPNSLLDLWPQMYLVDFGERLGRTVTGYRQRFFEQDYMGYRYTIRPGCAEKIHQLLSDKVISMDADDYLEVPERIDLRSPVELPPGAMKKYKELEKTLLAELDTGEEVEAITAAALANKMLQFANGAAYYDDKKNWGEVHKEKLDALSDIIDDNPNENILVAYNYKFDLERLLKKFPQAVVLDKKQETIDRWNRGEIKMLLAHPACLHPSTEVLTEHRGWVRIVDVKDDERVYDGVEFVSHSGCSFSGFKPVIDVFGIKMTLDHKMLVDNRWERARNVRDCEDTRRKARHTYAGDDDYLSEMLTLRVDGKGSGAEREAGKPPEKKTLREVYGRNLSSHDKHQNLADLAWDDSKNHEVLWNLLRKLRGARDWCFREVVRFQEFLRGHARELRRLSYSRAHRQSEGLFQRELPLGIQHGTAIQQAKQSFDIVSRRANAFGRILSKSGDEPRGSDPKVECGNERGRSVRGLQEQQLPEEQKISDVYDLVDCGPRNRFVVRNSDGEVFISHNSAGHGLNLQSGGSMIVWFSLSWSLELYQQFNARLHRQGQTKPVRIIHIVAAGTIDERVLRVLGDKDATQASLLNALKA